MVVPLRTSDGKVSVVAVEEHYHGNVSIWSKEGVTSMRRVQRGGHVQWAEAPAVKAIKARKADFMMMLD